MSVSTARSNRINPELMEIYNEALTSARSPNKVDELEATDLVRKAAELDATRSGSSMSWRRKMEGSSSLERLYDTYKGKFDPKATNVVLKALKRPEVPVPVTPPVTPTEPSTPSSKVLLDYHAANGTVDVHWFPMMERPNWSDSYFLFRPNGPLGKYSRAFNTKALDYELRKGTHYSASETDKNWFGHCNNAAIASLIFKYPPRASVEKGGEVFNPVDIQGLMVVASDDLAASSKSWGARYGMYSNDLDEPLPTKLLGFLKEISSGPDSEYGFVLEAERDSHVWNYPIDSVKVTEFTGLPQGEGVVLEGAAVDEKTKFYKFEFKSKAAEMPDYSFMGYVTADGREDWVAFKDTKKGGQGLQLNPDFLWKPTGVRDIFSLKGPASFNPQVDLATIISLYRQSAGV